MTYLCNARNKTLTTANAELYLTVIGFSHMWSYMVQGGLSSGRSVISVARVSLSLSLWNLLFLLVEAHSLALVFPLPLLFPLSRARSALWSVRDNRDVILSVL